MFIALDAIIACSRLVYIDGSVGKEEKLAVRCKVGKVKRYLAKTFQSSAGETWRVEHEVKDVTAFMMVDDPFDNKLANLAYLYFLHHIAFHIDVLRIIAVIILQSMKTIQRKKIVQAGGVNLIFPLTVLCQPFYPEPGRKGVCHKVLEVLFLRAQSHPVAKILAAVSSIVFVIFKPFRQPYRMDVDVGQCKLRAFAAAGVVYVRYVIQDFDVFHDLAVLL